MGHSYNVCWKGLVQYPLFGLHMDNAYRFDCNWSILMCHQFFEISCICYEMAMYTIACASHVRSRHSKAYLKLLFNVKGAM